MEVMHALKNKVQLIGQTAGEPEIFITENGSKRARFTMATNETYRNAKGDKVTETQWHSIVAWGRMATIAEKHLATNKEIIIEGKLVNRSYYDKKGNKKYATEIQVHGLLILGEDTK